MIVDRDRIRNRRQSSPVDAANMNHVDVVSGNLEGNRVVTRIAVGRGDGLSQRRHAVNRIHNVNRIHDVERCVRARRTEKRLSQERRIVRADQVQDAADAV